MGGTVSAKEGAKPKATTTAATTTTSTTSSTYNTAQNMTCKLEFKKIVHTIAGKIIITLVGCK